ncbi:phosphate--AMP phosphotransferase [Staphylococcus lutrae]|uniref:Phosphate--AMP phosphotransferase n=1 Tax=Staphylococcus lutrae TaxID=155085 RepID=A0AAC9WJ48_9STAP|nr:phosphate--AMP phosphotransferase [Staphylococcus lutrae]ARJ50613.1 phosphate--AMP phosphotransferase [Staphylococcus lutrae]PNZ38800.1 phosphate--AMP phosphotransferase [Staphylococcus lutrae]
MKKWEKLRIEIAELTRQTHMLGIPVMIVFEGVPASGKTRLTNELLLNLDAKYTNFIATKTPSEYDLRFPFLQHFWETLPEKGHIHIYFRSWYSHYVDYQVHGIQYPLLKDGQVLIDEMHDFESMLQADHHEIIKFFININEEKRQEHIAQMQSNPLTRWKAQEYEHIVSPDVYLTYFKPLLDDTWKEIDYSDREAAMTQMYEHLHARLTRAIQQHQKKKQVVDGQFTPAFQTALFPKPDEKISKTDYHAQIEALQLRLRELQFALYERKIPCVLVFEGMDAAGKGGNIKRIRTFLDPTGYAVNAISAPTDVELNHHYLWRFAHVMPKSGHIGIFDRSWYGRVLVERVEGFATKAEWSRAYDEINAFEKMWVNEGALILKFFLSLDKDEQLKRFKAREKDETKQWKITDEDWRNREKWDAYIEASHDMITRTDTEGAPWFVVPADHKKTARIKVLKSIIRKCEERLWGVKNY